MPNEDNNFGAWLFSFGFYIMIGRHLQAKNQAVWAVTMTRRRFVVHLSRSFKRLSSSTILEQHGREVMLSQISLVTGVSSAPPPLDESGFISIQACVGSSARPSLSHCVLRLDSSAFPILRKTVLTLTRRDEAYAHLPLFIADGAALRAPFQRCRVKTQQERGLWPLLRGSWTNFRLQQKRLWAALETFLSEFPLISACIFLFGNLWTKDLTCDQARAQDRNVLCFRREGRRKGGRESGSQLNLNSEFN